MARYEWFFLLAPFLPLVVAAVTARIVAGCVRRNILFVAAPASGGLAAMCVIGILPLLALFSQPTPGSGGPWGFGGSSANLICYLALVYGAVGAVLGLLIAALVFAFRSSRS
ncbi:MAG: hypothetical protein L0211_01430 [Planctomycetaceae bacterium]|nr:hypothetical protein [Planctomycetaceae bacterium]